MRMFWGITELQLLGETPLPPCPHIQMAQQARVESAPKSLFLLVGNKAAMTLIPSPKCEDQPTKPPKGESHRLVHILFLRSYFMSTVLR